MATMNLFRLGRAGCAGANLLLRQPVALRSYSALALRTSTASSSALCPRNQELVQKRGYVSKASSSIWLSERILSGALLVTLPIGIICPGNMLVDLAIGLCLPLHVHFGIHQVGLDYIHSDIGHRIFGITLPLMTGLAILSFFYFNTTDIGITAAFRKFWKTL